MGRKGKSFQRVKCINVLLGDKVIQIELNMNERIKNEDDLNLIALNPKKRKAKTMVKVKKVKQQNEENPLNAAAKIVQTNADDQSNENTFQFNHYTDTTFNDENTEFDIGSEFDDFNCFGEFNFGNEENNDLFFDMENLDYLSL